MRRLAQRVLLALAILAALVAGASGAHGVHVGIDGGQTRGAAKQAASVVDASSGGLPRVHRARKLIETDPRYGSAVRRVLTDVGDAEGGGRDRGAGTPRAGAFDTTPHRQRGVNAVGIVRLGRRVVDAKDELAAEANVDRISPPRGPHASRRRPSARPREPPATTARPSRTARRNPTRDGSSSTTTTIPWTSRGQSRRISAPTRKPHRRRSSSSSRTGARVSPTT